MLTDIYVMVLIPGYFGVFAASQFPDSITVGLPWTQTNTTTTLTDSIQSINNAWMVFNHSFQISDIQIPPYDQFQHYIKACRQWSDIGASSFISDLSCREKTQHSALVNHLNLPHVSASQEICINDNNKNMVNFNAEFDHPLKVLEEIVKKLEWNRLIVLHDDVFDQNEWLDDFISLSADWNISISLHNVDSGQSLDGLLSSFQPVTDLKWPYVLFTSLNSTLEILEHAKEEYLRTRDYTWLIYGQNVDFKCLVPHLATEDNVAILSHENDSMPYHNLAAGALGSAYQTVFKRGMWKKEYGVVKKCKSFINENVKNTMINQLIRETVDLEVCHNCSQYTIRSSVTFQDGIPRLIPVAEYQREDGLIKKETFFPNSFNGFNNRTFHVTSLAYSFFQKKIELPDGTYKWTGLTFEILDELARDLNFTYVVTEPSDGQWGIQEDDGNWTGMIAQVIKEEVEFAAAGFSVTSQREKVVDFAAPYFHEQSVVILKRPAEDTKVFLYAYPFRWEVWLCIGISIILTAGSLYLYTMHTPVYDNRSQWKVRKTTRHAIFDRVWSFWTVFGALMQQGNIWMPEAQSGRTLVGAFWLFCIVVVATYTGNLIAFLAVNKVRMPFDTLASMVKQTSVKYGPASGVALVMLFRDATFDPYKTVAKTMHLAPSYGTGLQWVKSGNFAFIAEKSWYNAISADDCEIAMAKGEFYPTNYAWAFQTGAPYLKLFSDRIDKMRETGLLDNWIQKWTPQNLQCRGLGPITNARVASLKDFQGGFYVLVAGVIFGIFALISECIMSRVRHLHSKPNHENDQVTHYRPPDVTRGFDHVEENEKTKTVTELHDDIDDNCLME